VFAHRTGLMMGLFSMSISAALHDLTGTWTVPLVVLLLLFVPQAAVGVLAGRERFVGR
jgi:CP family cyanate transporter-like MFS transporter